MQHPVKGIDHVFLLVNDLDASQTQFERLGFTLSPRGLHSKAKGSANHTIMFPNDYFELLGLVTPTETNAKRRQMLKETGEGLHAIACRIDDAAKAAEALAKLNFRTEGLGSFERPVPLPGGGEGIAAFSTVTFGADETPMGTVFMCQHKTPQTVWLPDLLEHPNSATGLAEVIGVSDDPARDAGVFARLYADGAAANDDGAYVVQTGPNSAVIRLIDPAGFAARYPNIDLDSTAKGAFAALVLKSADLDKTAAALRDGDITFEQLDDRIIVAPEYASGSVLEFQR